MSAMIRTHLVLLLALILPLAQARGEGRVSLTLEPASAELREALAGTPATYTPAPGRVGVIATFNDSAFAVPTLERLSLLSPDGTPHPFTVDSRSLLTEFDEVISARIAFDVDPSAPTNATWTLTWGSHVTGNVTKADALQLDAATLPSLMTFTWNLPAPGKGDGYSDASIEVIADSHANYYALWYLLPMVILFGILSIRKFRTHD